MCILLWLPNIRAKDVFPFIEESLLRLEGRSKEKSEVTPVNRKTLNTKRVTFVTKESFDHSHGSSAEDKRNNESQDQGLHDAWSSWSPWMACSRSCDGGISISLRKCRGRCPSGEPIRRQICNMQPCPEPHDFRATQCSAYNNRPYRDRKYVWLPFHDPEDPCALTCQAKGFNFVAKLSQKVLDGTRCREGALDMCVDGQCQQRIVVKFHFKLGKTATESYNLLKEVYASECLSRARLFEWYKRFKDGQQDVEDDSRPGRPSTSKTDENVEKVASLIRSDRRLSIRAIAETVNSDKECVRQILHDNLNMQKVCAEMVPKILTFEQQATRKNVCTDILDAIKNDPNLLEKVIKCEGNPCFLRMIRKQSANPCIGRLQLHQEQKKQE
ncbi:ADAMTS-like protein 3 [Trichonephila clavipes]|nr:ADAMTS-like protein 3 [Trichonephila clavipes]